jgi:hypothetical protein
MISRSTVIGVRAAVSVPIPFRIVPPGIAPLARAAYFRYTLAPFRGGQEMAQETATGA